MVQVRLCCGAKSVPDVEECLSAFVFEVEVDEGSSESVFGFDFWRCFA